MHLSSSDGDRSDLFMAVLLRAAFAITTLLVVTTGEANLLVRKTIKSEDGDIIDCIDTSNQNQVKPERSMKEKLARSDLGIVSMEWPQTWRRRGSCPVGTLPIRRESSPGNFTTMELVERDWHGELEVAAGYSTNGPYHGVHAQIPYFQIEVQPQEFSMSYIMVGHTLDNSYMPWIGAKRPTNLTNQIMVGVMAWPSVFGDSLSRLFIYYTNDNGTNHNCFNLECGGFVQLPNSSVALGSAWNPVSQVGGDRYGITVGIHRDDTKLIWWVTVMDHDIGYFPESAFDTRFPEGSYVEIGGRVLNTRPGEQHTPTPMGSAMPVCAGSRFAATMKSYFGINANGELFLDKVDRTIATTPSCYDARPLGFGEKIPGYYFAFGGPGGIYCDHPES